MFDFLVETLERHGKSIHAYRVCAEQGYSAAAATPDAAAALFLLARLAEAFADVNERMPITASDVDSAFVRFGGHVRQLNAAWSDGTETARLAALNRVAGEMARDGAA